MTSGREVTHADYRYRSAQASLLLPVYRSLLWDRLLPLIPTAVTPNSLTVAGTCCAAVACLLALLSPPAPRSVLAASAVLVLAYLSLDNLDGHHARRTGQSSAVGEMLDHYLDTFNSGFVTVAVCRAVGLPAWATAALVCCANVSFFAVHWAHRRTGVMRLGRLADIEGNTAAALVLGASAVVDVGRWAIPVWLLAGGLAVQALWTVAGALRQVAGFRADWGPMLVASGAVAAWGWARPPAPWVLVLMLALLNVLGTGRMIADRILPRSGPRFDVVASGLVMSGLLVVLLSGPFADRASTPAGCAVSAALGGLAVVALARLLRVLRHR